LPIFASLAAPRTMLQQLPQECADAEDHHRDDDVGDEAEDLIDDQRDLRHTELLGGHLDEDKANNPLNDFAEDVTRPQLRAALLQKTIDTDTIGDSIDMDPATEPRDQTADDAGNDPADDEQDERAQNVGYCSEKTGQAGGQTGHEAGSPVSNSGDVHRFYSSKSLGAQQQLRNKFVGAVGALATTSTHVLPSA
jgi:hypothetical protein